MNRRGSRASRRHRAAVQQHVPRLTPAQVQWDVQQYLIEQEEKKRIEKERLATLAQNKANRKRCNKQDQATIKAIRKQRRREKLHSGILIVPKGYRVRGPQWRGRYLVTEFLNIVESDAHLISQ